MTDALEPNVSQFLIKGFKAVGAVWLGDMPPVYVDVVALVSLR